MDPHRSPVKGHRKLQLGQNNLQTKERTTTSVLLEKFKLKTLRFRVQNKKVETAKPLDNWQRQVEFISIQLKQLTTEADSPTITPQTTEQDIPRSPSTNSCGMHQTFTSQTQMNYPTQIWT